MQSRKQATELDKWLYVLRNMSRMDKLPVFLRKTIFEKVFSIAEYSNMTKEEKMMYNTLLKRKWDNQNILDYAIQTAKAQVIKEERAKAEADKRETALVLKKMGMASKDIAIATKLPLEEIERL